MKKYPALKENNNNLVLVSNGDDWEGLYVDGKKVFSHHKVDIEEISLWSARLQMQVIKKYCTEKFTQEMQDGPGDFPDKLSEIELQE